MFDDSGDDARRADLVERYPGFRHIGVAPTRGRSGAIGAAWSWLAENSDARFVFQLGPDATLDRRVYVDVMARILRANEHLAQVALPDSPSDDIERWPKDRYTTVFGAMNAYSGVDGVAWMEHDMWTRDPCLYRTDILEYGWPNTDVDPEGEFTRIIRRDGTRQVTGDKIRFAYLIHGIQISPTSPLASVPN